MSHCSVDQLLRHRVTEKKTEVYPEHKGQAVLWIAYGCTSMSKAITVQVRIQIIIKCDSTLMLYNEIETAIYIYLSHFNWQKVEKAKKKKKKKTDAVVRDIGYKPISHRMRNGGVIGRNISPLQG